MVPFIGERKMVTNSTERFFVTFIFILKKDCSRVWLPMVTSAISEWTIIRPHKCDEKWSQTNVTVFQEFPD